MHDDALEVEAPALTLPAKAHVAHGVLYGYPVPFGADCAQGLRIFQRSLPAMIFRAKSS